MKQIILILMSIFLLSGCTIFYEITIDEGLTITENISFKEDNVIFDEYTLTKEEYNDMLKFIQETADKNNYKFINNSKGNNLDLNLNKRTLFKNFEDPILLRGKYKNLKTTCNEKFCSLTASIIENDVLGDSNIIFHNISISVPFEVIKHNAESHNEKTNTYNWYYSPVDKPNNIEIVFKNGGKNIIKANKTKTKTKLIIYVIIGLVMTSLILVTSYKVYRSNKATL